MTKGNKPLFQTILEAGPPGPDESDEEAIEISGMESDEEEEEMKAVPLKAN